MELGKSALDGSQIDCSPRDNLASVERYSTILNMVLEGLPLNKILFELVLIIEAQKIGTRASVLLLSNDGKSLLSGAAPNLPEEYNQAIHGVKIGPKVGSCGAAAFLKQRVIVEDIEQHPNWQPYKLLPMKAGLKACWSEPIFDSFKNVLGTFAMYYDTVKSPTEQDLFLIQEAARLASLAIERSRGLYVQRLSNMVFKSLPLGFAVTTDQFFVLNANANFSRFAQDTVDQNSLFHVDQFFCLAKDKLALLHQQLQLGAEWQDEITIKVKAEVFHLGIIVTVLRDPLNQENCFAWLITDLTQSKNAEKMIHFQQNYDQLTGLANRKHLLNTLQSLIQMSETTSTNIALLVFDLDYFKQINDSLGSDSGDKVLVEVAKRFTQGLPSNSFTARVGADEFVLVLYGDFDSVEITSTAKQLKQSICKDLIIGNARLSLTLSVGIARYPQDANGAESLLNSASQAMYSAKEKGRNCIQYFDNEIQRIAERENYLHSNLQHAIANNELELAIQPIVCPKKNTIVKAEVLLRWLHKGEYISPVEFIPIAERTGLIVDIGEWVKDAALSLILMMRQQQIDIPLAVNVSSLEFWSKDLQQRFMAYFDKACTRFNLVEFPYSSLILEITESLMMKQQQQVANLLEELRGRGLKISIDDFGTGFSSLSYLSQFPVDQIKIDKSFIKQLDDKKSHALVEGIVAMSRAMELSIVAEGVETEPQLAMINAMGIDCVQGYYFYQPMPVKAFMDLVLTK